MTLLLATPTVLRWIDATAAADAPLAAVVGARRYEGVAPEGTAFPYLLTTVLVPGIPEYRVGARAVVTEGVYLIRGVVQDEQITGALEAIATRILLLFHGIQSRPAGIVSSVLEDLYMLTEVQDEVQYRHLGGRFRITALA